MMPVRQEVANGTAVAGDKSVESPFVAQYLLLVTGLGAARLTVDTLVGAHHLGHLSFLYQRLEGGQISLPEVALGQVLYIELMTIPLRSAMHRKMLGTGQQLAIRANTKVFAVIAHTLQTSHHSQSHLGCQIRVFAIGLLPTSPTWITEDIDIRRPERQTLIALDIARALGLLGFHTSLVAHGSKHPVQQGIVPRGSHRHSDGKDSSKAIATHTVKGLVPPLELRDTQAGNSRRGIHHETDFLVDGKTRQ